MRRTVLRADADRLRREPGCRLSPPIHGGAARMPPILRAPESQTGAADLPPTTGLLADLPRMLEDMVSSVLEPQPDIRVVRGEAHERDLIAAAAASGAHVVVVTRRDPANLAEVDPHLARAASVSIIALAADGAWACLY